MATPIEKFTEGGDSSPFKHGTSSAYSYHKCRCEECVQWKKRTSREYYERNAEKVRARNNAYSKENREKINVRAKATRAANPEKRREWEHANYAKDPERYYRKQRAWEQKNPWRTWFYGWRNRERQRGQFYDEATLEWVKSLVDPVCTYCGQPAEGIDHRIPRARGGSNNRENLTPACHKCNKRKGAMDEEAFMARLRREGVI